MKTVLILGGSNFIGRRLVEHLQDLELYKIVLFNRAKTNAELFPTLERIKGNRENEEELHALYDKRWDYVIDLSGYFPASVRNLVNNVNRDLKKYIYISTCSVYDQSVALSGLKTESSPILDCTLEEETDTSPLSYGNRKAECERAVRSSGLQHLILRPALVFGPYDHTDRLYYWLYQLKTSEYILIPEGGMRLLSLTYVDDLVLSIIKALELETFTGTFNCTSYPRSSIEQLIKESSSIIPTHAECISASAEFLKIKGVSEWTDIPLWLQSDGFVFSNESIQKETGILPADFKERLKETIEYYTQLGFYKPKVGLSDERKQCLLDELLDNG